MARCLQKTGTLFPCSAQIQPTAVSTQLVSTNERFIGRYVEGTISVHSAVCVLTLSGQGAQPFRRNLQAHVLAPHHMTGQLRNILTAGRKVRGIETGRCPRRIKDYKSFWYKSAV
jgi:hypothetical protein